MIFKTMETINFVTGNVGKVKTLQNKLPSYKVKQIELEIVEPQLDSVEEIVKSKALSAYNQIQDTVVVQDTGFVIPVLNNFPGPYIKYIIQTIGIQGILDLMENQNNRECYFVGSTGFYSGGKVQTFTVSSKPFRLAREARGELPKNAWSPLWQILIPPSSETKTLAELGGSKVKENEKNKQQTDLDKLAQYLNQS